MGTALLTQACLRSQGHSFPQKWTKLLIVLPGSGRYLSPKGFVPPPRSDTRAPDPGIPSSGPLRAEREEERENITSYLFFTVLLNPYPLPKDLTTLEQD